MDTPAAEPSSYGTFDTLCGLVAGSAVIMLAVGACLLFGALVTYANVDQPGTTDIAKLESKALAASLVSYGVTCFTSGIPLLIFSYGGWIFLDLARNNRLQVQKTDEVLKHLAEINPKYEERLRRETGSRTASCRGRTGSRTASCRGRTGSHKAQSRERTSRGLGQMDGGAQTTRSQAVGRRGTPEVIGGRGSQETGKRASTANPGSPKRRTAQGTKSSPRLGKRTGSATLPG